MPVLYVGSTEIPYTIRHSKKAKRLSIKVTPSSVEAIAPEDYSCERINKYIGKKREWIYRRVEDLAESSLGNRFSWPDRFVTGAKIPFRGRNMKLVVKTKNIADITVLYRSAFIVEKPVKALETEVKAAVEKWLGFRLNDDVRDLIKKYAPKLGVKPGLVRISLYKTRWGSCGKNGDIMINWLLILAPKPVLEYVVVHELSHLRHRNHSPEYWSLVATYLPDFQYAKAWLKDKGRFMSL